MRVDHEEAHMPVDDLALDTLREVLPDLIRTEWRIEQEGAAWQDWLEHINPFEEPRLVTTDKLSF